MGKSFSCECTKCGYEIYGDIGIGFLYPEVYKKTVEKIKRGELGNEIKNFMEAFENGAIDCENVMAKCTDCGECFQVQDLTMYVPKADYNARQMNKNRSWCVAFPFHESDYVSPCDLKKYFEEFEKYDHRCPKCGGEAEIVKSFERKLLGGAIKCTKCGGDMKLTDIMLWD